MDTLVLKEENTLKIDKENSEKKIEVISHTLSSLYIERIKDNTSLFFDLKEGSSLKLSIFVYEEVKNLKIDVEVAKNASISIYFADFSSCFNSSEVVINLNEDGANAHWHLASLSSKEDRKNISISVYHKAMNTYGKVDNYGVAKDQSKLVFSGTSHILNGAIKSSTQQNAKIMVFDPESDAMAKPILKIDENDIEASHSAAVGKISDEEIFYLTSRGLNEEQAKMLITLGYLKPIFKGFNENQINMMNEIIEKRL